MSKKVSPELNCVFSDSILPQCLHAFALSGVEGVTRWGKYMEGVFPGGDFRGDSESFDALR